MTTKEWLNQYHKLKKEIKADRRLLRDLRAQAQKGTSSYSAERHSGTDLHSRLEHYACKAADLSVKIDKKIAESEEMRAEIYNAIMTVEDAELRTLLKLRYIQSYSWTKIALEMNFNVNYLKSVKHNKALWAIEKDVS